MSLKLFYSDGKKKRLDINTEEKIKNAARVVFHKKGFSATRTRDIAEEAGINLALLNYYFRSKEKLFEIIIVETMQVFFKSIAEVFNDEETSLEKKIEALASGYIDLMTVNPDIPLFILSELKVQPDTFLTNLGVKEILLKSSFFKQFQQGVKEGRILPIHPFQYIMTLMGMIIFPFVANPIIKGLGNLSQKEFEKLMKERKALIPVWMNAILTGK